MMKERFSIHPWKVIETAFDPNDLLFSESLFSLGNGAMGLRGNFEEDYSGKTHQGTYIGGVWFPDKTRVGWWKNGYPQYFGKVINAPNLIGLHIKVNGTLLDADRLPVVSFHRELDMQAGTLSREVVQQLPEGKVTLSSTRFVSMDLKALLAQWISVKAAFAAHITIEAYLDSNVHNADSNYRESFWQQLDTWADKGGQKIGILCRTKENPFGTPRFTVAAACRCQSTLAIAEAAAADGFACLRYEGDLQAGEAAELSKFVCIATDRDHKADDLPGIAADLSGQAALRGFDTLLRAHRDAWAMKWRTADVQIMGDDEAQQGIRFNLFQLLSTYTGEDARLNIGPKGFTGEKYGGATYWDTEAYCFSVYMAIAGQDVARQLLLYRHQQLDGAYHNAAQQGLKGALYPMVTFNGIECHNEWEITFEEIHRNAAIAHAIFNYTSYTDDTSYLMGKGLEVLLGIARFWADRVHQHQETGLYMIHGVTGPNEYENNVNNNWYTNRMAAWCLDFFCRSAKLAGVKRRQKLGVAEAELQNMRDIADNMYYPESQELGVFVQHDTFLDKDLRPASSLEPRERPINMHWSWDRILRSCFIKQADVLQGLYFLNHLYDIDAKRRNFDFYEPMTVHESSLSPCVHAILAAELGYREKALEMYKRTARLDLDDINHDTSDGLHITSMAGSWLAITQGFAGMRTTEGLSLSPFLPEGWQGYALRILYRGRRLHIAVDHADVTLTLEEGPSLGLKVYGTDTLVETVTVTRRTNR